MKIKTQKGRWCGEDRRDWRETAEHPGTPRTNEQKLTRGKEGFFPRAS